MRTLAAALVVLAVASSAASSAVEGVAGVTFEDRAGRLTVTTSAYRLVLDARDGRILELVDRSASSRVARGPGSCLWRAESRGGRALTSGCSFGRRGARRLAYRWSAASATLTLDYRDPVSGSAALTLRARPELFDLRLTIENRGATLTTVSLPGDLLGDTRAVEAGYAPNVLPGVRLGPGFFERVRTDLHTYPSRWAFADYLALDSGRGRLALYSVNSGPIRPVALGFLREAPPSRCSGASFCIAHRFQTWITKGTKWTSPVVRARIGRTAQQSILAYRRDNGIDAYPSVQAKLGGLMPTLARAPLVKADAVKLGRPLSEWAAGMQELPSPALLHPVAFQPGGHDGNVPDFLPPDPRFGSSADLASVVEAAHSLDQLVMPYLNASWWSPESPTMRSLPPALAAEDLAVLDRRGEPVVDSYGQRSGVVVSPHVPFVRSRVARLLEEWRTEVPADCVFLDQLGARPWIRDFNPASPSPEAYHDGWLTLLVSHADRCLMVEDGWDRLARDASGFHGSLLMLAREHDLPNRFFGEGNWEPYPLATWLLHDKVLLYHHDLYPGTMTADDELLAWSMAFGLIGSYEWREPADPADRARLDLVGALQRALGPHFAGVPLASYRNLARDVTESTFGELVVVANQRSDAYATDRHTIAPEGFVARTRDDSVLAGAFVQSFDGASLSEGTHYVVVERDDAIVTVRQPLGASTDLAVAPPLSWSAGRALEATAIAPDGSVIGPVGGELRGDRFVFRYAEEVNGRPVAAYRITVPR